MTNCSYFVYQSILGVSRNSRAEDYGASTNNASPFVVAKCSQAFAVATTYPFTSQSGFRGIGDAERQTQLSDYNNNDNVKTLE
jgi:hypothetical protein